MVHAYCGQTFGTTGPLWYREGMAQLMTSGGTRSRGMEFPPEILECLTPDQKQSLADVVSSGQQRPTAVRFVRRQSRSTRRLGRTRSGQPME